MLRRVWLSCVVVAVLLGGLGAAPRAALRTVTLGQFGPQPQRLGAACLAALDSAH